MSLKLKHLLSFVLFTLVISVTQVSAQPATPPASVPTANADAEAAAEAEALKNLSAKELEALLGSTKSPYIEALDGAYDFDLQMKGNPWYNNCILDCFAWAQSCRCNNCVTVCNEGRDANGYSNYTPQPVAETLECFNTKCRQGYNNCLNNCSKQ